MEFNNNTFKIVQFTDTHFGNLPHHKDDLKTFDLIDKILKLEKPDLIIHTGDIMWSDGVKDSDKVFTIAMEHFDKHNIPLAITLSLIHISEPTRPY